MANNVLVVSRLTWVGHKTFDPQAKIDLAIDGNQDALAINASGNVLVVQPQTQWVGRPALDPQEVDLAIDAAGDLLAID